MLPARLPLTPVSVSAYWSGVVVGLVVIWVGHFCRWTFVRDLRFRVAHLLAIGLVLAEALTGSDGRFEFRKVPAGFVTVLAAEWSVSRQSASFDFDLHADETREVKGADGSSIRLTVEEILTHVFTHELRHQGQLQVVLRLLGKKPPNADWF